MNILFYFKYFGFAFFISYVFAKLEIQIEGKNGWARKLPTWRIKYSFFKLIPWGNKELTGYHFYLWIFITSILHIQFIFFTWDIKKELFLLSFLVLILVIEDFLWVVYNPYYGLKKFKKNYISWHKVWLGQFPIQYYVNIFVWFLLFYYANSIK